MLHLLVTFAALQAPLGPAAMPGTNQEFLKAVLAVQTKLESGDFAGAKAAAARLPKRRIRVEWDDSQAPRERRVEFAESRDKALKAWGAFFSGFEFQLGKPADIRISFARSLAKTEQDSFEPGAAHFWSEDPKEPRLEVVIALRRGPDRDPCESLDVHNEVAYAIASYYGLAQSPYVESYSYRTELPFRIQARPKPFELSLARRNVELADSLEKFADSKMRVVAPRPKLHLDPRAISGGKHVQGETPTFTIQVSNLGNAPMGLSIATDCGCVATALPPSVEPGQTVLSKITVDTTEFVGSLHRSLTLYSNDPENPFVHIPIDVVSEPLYRWISKTADTALLGDEGAEYEAYLIPAAGSNLKPLEARVDGVSGSVTFEPWSGRLADPELGEPEAERSGYRFRVRYEPGAPPGRMFSTIVVRTNSKSVLERNGDKFEILRHNVMVQRGIVVMPERLIFNEMRLGPRRMFFLISRPGKGFKILRAEADKACFSFQWKAVKSDWEYRVTVEFDGKADPGLLQSTFRVMTDDKEQPVIEVPFRAILR